MTSKPDRRFEIPSAIRIVDKQSFYERASSELQPMLPTDLIRMIFAYAADPVYTWPERIDDAAISVVGGNRLVGTDTDRNFRRIIASQLITDGFRRWRILVEFGTAAVGSIAIGASTAAVGGRIWNTAAPNYETDIIQSTSDLVYHADVATMEDDVTPFRPYPSPANLQVMAVVEFDTTRRLLTTTICGTMRTAYLSDGYDWRPCVFVLGRVSATILAWPDDYCYVK